MAQHRPESKQNRPKGNGKPAAPPCRVWVGTCGYSYTGWTESGFYPPDAQPGRMLALYARHFPVTELTQTWYQMPKADAVERRRREVPSGFLFVAKANRELTHDVEPERWKDQAQAFRHGIAPLVQAGQLAAVLVQLPETFDRSPSNRRHLAALIEAMEGLPLAVEFRQGSWNVDRVFVELARRGVTLVSVDAPDLPGLFPALDVVTNPELFYVRFHGRNTRGWRQGKPQLMFDYDYTEAELREWAEKRILPMAGRTRQGVVLFNNHVRAQAAKNALAMKRLLQEYGLVLAQE